MLPTGAHVRCLHEHAFTLRISALLFNVKASSHASGRGYHRAPLRPGNSDGIRDSIKQRESAARQLVQMVQSSYALGLPSTSTPSSSVAGHKRSPIHRHSARQKKRQRVVMEESSSSNSNDSNGIGSMSKTADASPSQQGSSTSLSGLISGLMRALRFSNPHDIQPTPSSSSSKQASSLPESRVRDWNDMSTACEGASTIADITREPEDDTMFLSPPALPSGLPSSSTSTSLMPSESNTQQQRRHGHVPMFQDEVGKCRPYSSGCQLTRPLTPISSSGHSQAQIRARQRRERKKQALGLLNPHLARRNRDPVNESVTSGDTSSLGLSSHTYSETTSPPSSRYAASDRTLQNRHTVAYSCGYQQFCLGFLFTQLLTAPHCSSQHWPQL